MSNQLNPKVFISHASEDKERFVLDFAKKLLTNGLDVWLDHWEILPGDSLVDKILEEGIKDAQAIIIVVSKNSVNKAWVKEELNNAVIERIKRKTKLIPIIIDDCEVPKALQSIVWVKVKDLNNYEDELRQVLSAIYGYKDKPSIGKPPAWTQIEIDPLPDFTKRDSLIFKVCCEYAIEKESLYGIDTSKILSKLELLLKISKDEFYDIIEILDGRGYIMGLKVGNYQHIPMFSITTFGFEKYAEKYIQNYNSILVSIIAQIVNNKLDTSKSISKAVEQPEIIVSHILNVFAGAGLLKVINPSNGGTYIVNASPELKRILQMK